MVLVDRVRHYYDKTYDLNCAETIIYAANKEYDLGLKKETLKTMSAFGGGMGIESVCGAITGALAVIGIMFTKERGHESERVKLLSQEFFQRFVAKLGTDNCKALKERYKNDEMRCSIMVEVAAEILEDIVSREKKKH